MEDKNKRKSIIYLTIGVLTLIALVVGATYAFFQAQNKNGASFNTNVTAGTTDNLTFSINDLDVKADKITDDDGNNGIVINATQQNFKSGANSIGDGVIGKAILIANDSSKEASYKYYVYVNIINNDLEYTSYKNEGGNVKLAPLDDNDKTTYTKPVPELVMTIRKNGQPYTDPIDGINQTTITIKDGEVIGYDITEVRRNILIEEATIEVMEGTKDLRTEDEWEISIILKNLETDQQLNTDKEVKGEVLIQSEKIEPIQNKLLADANKPKQEETLLYHNGEIIIDEQIMDAGDYSYRYAGGDYKITARYKDEYDSVYAVVSDNDFEKKLIRFKCNDVEQYVGSTCNSGSKEYYYLDYEEKEQYPTLGEALQKAFTDGYIEPNVNNYVCFGGECSNNPEEEEKYSNLYRIIGLFPTDSSHTTYQLKIIKADATTATETGGAGVGAYLGPYGSVGTYNGHYGYGTPYRGNSTYFGKIQRYHWNKIQNGSGDNTNNWKSSNLNKVNLNETYLNYIKNKDSEKWYNMIEEHIWTTAGNDQYEIYTQNAKTVYGNEITSPDVGTELPDAATKVKARVGLMYISDYMYAASKDYWTKQGFNSNAENDYRETIKDNWLYMGLNEWAITRQADVSSGAFCVDSTGTTYRNSVNMNWRAIRPTLYLKPDVKIFSGSGTASDPYIISQ